MIQAVIFDFGNVICRFDPKIFVRGIAPHSARPLPELTSLLMHSADLFTDYETGRISSPTFLELMSVRCELSCSQDQFIAAFSSIFTPNLPMFALIRHLKPRYRLGILSNTSEWHFLHGIRPAEVFPLFDTVTLSYEVGVMKPGEEIYRDALEKLALPAEACVYIDDIREYADAATALGLHGMHYVDDESLMKRLAAIGVRV
jgi:epoxide hydrolase-like predicted phosphatase